MIYKKDTSLKACQNFNAQVQVLDVLGQPSPATPPSRLCAAAAPRAR